MKNKVIFLVAVLMLLLVQTVCLADELIGGGSMEQAVLLTEGSFGREWTSPYVPLDGDGAWNKWYTFTAPVSGKCHIRAKYMDTSCDLTIRNRNGEKIKELDLSNEKWDVFTMDVQLGEVYYLQFHRGVTDWAYGFSVCFDGYHKPGTYSITLTESTCTAEGTSAFLCDLCGEPTQISPIAAKGHRSGVETVMREATCLQTGLKGISCLDCGEILSSVDIPLAPHSPGQYVDTRPATCTADGVRIQYCAVCNITINTETVQAYGHSYSEWIVTKEKKLFSTGEHYRVCDYCGNKQSESF